MSFDTRLLDKYNIPHFDGHVQLDLWALTNSYMIIDNSIWNQIGERAIAYSPQYGAGWSTWNEKVISPIDAETNMILLWRNALFSLYIVGDATQKSKPPGKNYQEVYSAKTSRQSSRKTSNQFRFCPRRVRTVQRLHERRT